MSGLEKHADAFKKVGAAVTGFGVLAAAGFGSAIKTGMEFDSQMSRVGAISEATADQFTELRNVALDLGASTTLSASEVAKGMETVAAMGFDVNQVIGAMPGIISAAAASGTDLTVVADTMASAINAFGLEATEASRVADILAMTANRSAASVEDMQYAFKYAAGPAHALGISIEALSAATGIMVDMGSTGESAGTTLRSALLTLVDPTKEALKGMNALGLSVTDASGAFLPLDNIIMQLTQSTADMTNAQKVASISQIFGAQATTGMLNLIAAGPEKLNAMTTALENSTGASQKAADMMNDNFAGAMEEMSGALETMAIRISDALTPAVQWFTDKITVLTNKFNALSPKTQKTIAIIAALTAGFALIAGPILLLIGFIPTIIAGFTAISTVAGVLSGAIMAITWPVIAVIAGIAALIAISILIYKNWGDISAWLVKTWDGIKTAAVDSFNRIKSFITDTFGDILGFVKNLGLTFRNAGAGLIDMMADGISAAANRVLDTVRDIASQIRDFLPFSPAKTGPLSDLDKLDFAGPITDSIGVGLPDVQAKMSHLLDVPEISAKTSTANSGGIGGRGGTTFYITVNAADFTDPEHVRNMARILGNRFAFEIGGAY